MNSLQSKDGIRMWTTLDNACVCACSCLFALSLRFFLGWVRAIRDPCCSDISCWVEWWKRQQNAVPLLGLLAIMAFHGSWNLGIHSSMMPQGINLPYPPSSFIAGVLCGLSALVVLNSQALLQTMDTPVTLALEEGAARIVLWFRLVGLSVVNEERLLNRMISLARLLMAAFCGSVGFVLYGPFQSTVSLMVYRWQRIVDQPNKKWSSYRDLIAMASQFVLPLLIIFTYVVPEREEMPRRTIRTMAAWCHVCMMCGLAKSLLQSYMDQALPAVAMVLTAPNPDADRIMDPFRIRFQRLVQTGSQLVTFPFCLIALLTVGHLCHVHSNMYPVPYAWGALDKTMRNSLDTWEQVQVVSMANSASNGTTVVSYISPTRANACGEVLERKNNKRWKRAKTGGELLAMAKPVKKSLVQVLSGLQVLALLAREDPVARTVLQQANENLVDPEEEIKDPGKAMDELLSSLTAVVQHPVLTSTIVFPLVDMMGFLLCFFWMVSLVGGVVSSWRRMRILGGYNMGLATKKEQ